VPPARPLDGIRVLELGQLLAGPFAGTILGYFGADVIKVEPPAGDPIRGWRMLDQGTSVWWRSLGRNKRGVTVDLRKAEGQALVRRLVGRCDVLIENFRPGTLERWGLDPEALRLEHPGLIVARVSGFGQTGPAAHRPGYASVAEAVGGLRHLNGLPDGPSVRPNLSLGDTLAGLHTALGVLLALLGRARGGSGQVVDVAIYEAVFNCLEAVVPEYDRFGVVRQASGATISGVVPTNTYPTADGRGVVIGANGDSNFRRLMTAVGRGDLAADPGLATNAGRVERRAEVDGAITAWTRARSSNQILAALEAAEVPAGLIYSVADMFADPHFAARGLFEEVQVRGGTLKVPAILPKLVSTPGRTDWAGGEIGSHNHEVWGELLDLTPDEIAGLASRGVI
jgi:crotonobetainyl-CoA:carnitine CoA-transferase CaiB-like acyl-CoA transferase